MANVRTNCRHADREGVTIQWYDGVPSKKVLEQLEPLSNAWLERKAGKHAAKMGFSLGRFDGLAEAAFSADALAETQFAGEDLPHDAVPRLVTGVATEQTGRPCAFVSFTPIYGSAHSWGWAVELMRRVPDAPR